MSCLRDMIEDSLGIAVEKTAEVDPLRLSAAMAHRDIICRGGGASAPPRLGHCGRRVAELTSCERPMVCGSLACRG